MNHHAITVEGNLESFFGNGFRISAGKVSKRTVKLILINFPRSGLPGLRTIPGQVLMQKGILKWTPRYAFDFAGQNFKTHKAGDAAVRDSGDTL